MHCLTLCLSCVYLRITYSKRTSLWLYVVVCRLNLFLYSISLCWFSLLWFYVFKRDYNKHFSNVQRLLVIFLSYTDHIKMNKADSDDRCGLVMLRLRVWVQVGSGRASSVKEMDKAFIEVVLCVKPWRGEQLTETYFTYNQYYGWNLMNFSSD